VAIRRGYNLEQALADGELALEDDELALISGLDGEHAELRDGVEPGKIQDVKAAGARADCPRADVPGRAGRSPTREAKLCLAGQGVAYLDAGQPMEDCGCDGCARCVAVVAAMERLVDRLASESTPREPGKRAPR
jgi:hypothetical protein